MFDTTPAPLGDVTRRWTHLDDTTRAYHVDRLLSQECPGHGMAHVGSPKADEGACYRRLVLAAVDGDPVGLGWIATTHRPLLVSHGRALLEADPSEWGAVCLELLHRIMVKADLSDPSWLRRRIARQLIHRLGRAVADHLDCRRHEHPLEPVRMQTRHATASSQTWDSKAELSEHLARLLAEVDPPTRDGLLALADHEPLYEVADRHGVSYAALRQRVTRARVALQPQLAIYRRPHRMTDTPAGVGG